MCILQFAIYFVVITPKGSFYVMRKGRKIDGTYGSHDGYAGFAVVGSLSFPFNESLKE